MTKKVVVVGTGIGGISAAYHLTKNGHEVILLEKEMEIGGHTYAIDIDGEKVDLGFMMFGDSNPNIKQWFQSFGLTKPDGSTHTRIPMSMSVTSDIPGDVQFSSRRPFLSIGDVFNPQLWRIITDIYRFTVDLLEMPIKDSITTKEWSQQGRYSHEFFRHYFLPFVAILWTIPKSDVMQLPASQFLRCLKTHSNSLYIPLWQVFLSVVGLSRYFPARPKHLWWYIGSKYIEPFLEYFKGQGGVVKCNANVVSVEEGGKSVTLASGEKITCDHVVLACHADDSAKMIPWSKSVDTLNKYHFHNSMMWVHRDPSFLPKDKRAWGSWNVRITEDDDYIMTYWMNRIQRLKSDKDVFVTITPLNFTGRVPADDLLIKSFPWDHPRLLADCIPECEILDEPGISLCGAWLGRGFHEDGFVAGRRCALLISDPKHKNTILYEDPDNIPVPAVPSFGMPMSVQMFFSAVIVGISVLTYQVVSMKY